MRRLIRWAVATAFALPVVAWQLPASAGGPVVCREACVPEAQGGNGGIDVTATAGHSEHVPGRGNGSNGYAPGRTTWTSIEEAMAPTCMGNTREGGDALCGAAVYTCPTGEIRFWVWHQTTTHVVVNGTDTATVTDPWHKETGSYCLGADDPQVPTIAKVIAQVQTDFAHLPLVGASVSADPGPTTLVNLPTAFSAGSAGPQTFDPVLLGVTVHISAKPIEWRWTWGDGTSDTTTTPGVPHQPVVTHTYDRVTDAAVSVVVKYAGTFTVGSDPTVYPITSPAYSPPSTATPVRVREARTQLVDG